MMHKRGMLVVVLGLFLVMVTSTTIFGDDGLDHAAETENTLAEEQTALNAETTINTQRFFSLGMVTDDFGYCEDNNIHIDYYDTSPAVSYRGCSFDSSDTIQETDDYSITSNEIIYSACAMNHIDQDGGSDNDCGQLLIRSGVQFGSVPLDLQYTPAGHNNYEYDWGENENTYCKNFYTDGPSYLCSDDHFWHRCSNPEDVGTVTWAENDILYECVMDDSLQIANWVSTDTDADHDGFIRSSDCDDNPSNDPAYCVGITIAQCGSPDYSHCAICTNPDAAEMCGDTIDNDCSEDTADDCNEFPAGCENRPLDVIHGEIEEGELSLTHTNIYGETFSWTDTDAGGYCCGYGGVNDLGKMINSEEGGGSRICLHGNQDLVGRSSDADPLAACGNGWCWATAALQDNAFHILTIKKPGEQTYDVVSNKNNWIECKEEQGTREISAPGAIINPDGIQNANRFYCYQEGSRWSWADCRDPLEATQASVNGIQERAPGDGLFALKIQNPEIVAGGVENIFIDLERNINVPRVDFTNLDPMYLEFFLRFKNLNADVPPSIQLKIFGPEQDGQNIVYYDQPVLGSAVNTPLLEANRWIHMKVPLSPELYDVKALRIDSTTRGNTIEVRNIFLSTGLSAVCSGERSSSEAQSSWLSDLDFSSASSTISGEKLCNALFDPAYETIEVNPEYQGKAWLGNYDDVTLASATCCGNNDREYYGDSSRAVGEQYYGCWNSEPLASGETTMNVEFSTSFYDVEQEITYPEEGFTVAYAINSLEFEEVDAGYSCPLIQNCDDLRREGSWVICDEFVDSDCTGDTFPTSDQTCRANYAYQDVCGQFDPGCTEGTSERISTSREFNCDVGGEENQGREIAVVSHLSDLPITDFDRIYYVTDADKYYVLHQKDPFEYSEAAQLSLPQSPLQVTSLSLDKDDFFLLNGQTVGDIILEESTNPKVGFLFLDTLSGEFMDSIDVEDLPPGITEYPIFAEVTSEYEISVEQHSILHEKDLSYVCHQEECLYPLPGNPPYIITNPHPDLYELYFIGIDVNEQPLDPTLITSSSSRFTTKGMISARKVAQQIIFINEGEDTETTPGFYGCQAAEYLESNLAENLNYCSVKAGKFCAYSVAQEDQREKFTTINSWSDEPVTKVGYQPIPDVEGDVNTFYDSNVLQLREMGADLPYEPAERNYSAAVLPARNFIPNALFMRDGNSLPHWEIRLSDGTRKENLRSNVDDALHIVTITTGEMLRSERIAVPQHTQLFFSSETTLCIPIVDLVNKDGAITDVGVEEFNSGDASYISLEFVGPCTITNPNLQLVDELDPISFAYVHQDYPDTFDARAGASCCPSGFCWNGYACVEPMSSSTYLAEHIADGRDYRCIEGQWKRLPLQFDWNAQKWGFCAQQEQCLVLPSTLGGNDANTAADFYEGHYPACINNGEYIFDHLCEAGNWTSRTKYVATKLLEVGENDDYTLYCTNYHQALTEFDDRENYLGGEFFQESEVAPTLGETLSQEAPAGSFTCFNTIGDPQGRRLVKDGDNTCVNNVCVLRFKQGGDFKVAFATTLNKNITNEDSFLFALNVPQDRLNQLCTGTAPFVECDLSELDIPGDLWYSSSLNAVMYGKEGLQITPPVVDRIVDWFNRFIGVESELSDESAFVSQAQNFREVYVLSVGNKKIRALKEILSEQQQMLIAEYEHFETPVCDYVNNLDVPPEAQTELLEELSGQQKVICSTVNGTQRVEAVAALDFFWPQLTGRLRAG